MRVRNQKSKIQPGRVLLGGIPVGKGGTNRLFSTKSTGTAIESTPSRPPSTGIHPGFESMSLLVRPVLLSPDNRIALIRTYSASAANLSSGSSSASFINSDSWVMGPASRTAIIFSPNEIINVPRFPFFSKLSEALYFLT